MRQGQKKLQRYITYSSAYIPEFKWLMCLKRLSALRTPAWFEEAKREPTARSISWRLWSNQLNPTCSNCWLNMEASSKRQIFSSVFFFVFFSGRIFIRGKKSGHAHSKSFLHICKHGNPGHVFIPHRGRFGTSLCVEKKVHWVHCTNSPQLPRSHFEASNQSQV